ncbi:hypothetical protein C8J56DRAFT_574558 [Mycena floridula]|nr:hypothetical protein C8J56DRAFT_574558 [Mycena floridula]
MTTCQDRSRLHWNYQWHDRSYGLYGLATHFSPRAMASFYSSSQGASGITRARSNAFVHLALRTCNIVASWTWFVVNGESRSAGCRGESILGAGERRVLDERARACMTEKRLGRTGPTSSSNDHRASLSVALAPPLLYRHSEQSIHRRRGRCSAIVAGDFLGKEMSLVH